MAGRGSQPVRCRSHAATAARHSFVFRLNGSDHELRKRDVRRPPWLLRAFRLWRDEGLLYIYKRAVLRQRRIHSYDPDWINAYEPSTPAHLQRIEARIAAFAQ